MKVKRFICDGCGAPKVNPYHSPYIVCDFCGSLVDIDLTLSMSLWKSDAKQTKNFQRASAEIQSELTTLLRIKNKEAYFEQQVKYWMLYYDTFPAYLPPTIPTHSQAYADYIAICADSSTTSAFDPAYNKIVARQNKDVKALQYYYASNGVVKVKPTEFFKMVQHHLTAQQEALRAFYENSKYKVIKDYLPHTVHLKMKISNLVQGWLPYLTDVDAKHFLEITGFATEFIDLPTIEGRESKCFYCNHLLFVPTGSVKVHCEKCHQTNIIQNNFNCFGCGYQNAIPLSPVSSLNCTSCGTANRLITPQFG